MAEQMTMEDVKRQERFSSGTSKTNHKEFDENGYLVIKDLWESNPECVFRGRKLKYICEYNIINDGFVGEDIMLCEKIKELGYQIWLNPKHTVSHIGTKKFKGNFIKSYDL